MRKRMFALAAVLLCLLAASALADDVCMIDMVMDESVATDCGYICVTCPVDADSVATLTVSDEQGKVHYQRSYSTCSGVFTSEEIYLRLSGAETRYEVSVASGETVYEVSVARRMPRLKGNAACSAGYPLSIITGQEGWKSATILDLQALEGAEMTVPMLASGAFILGEVTFEVQNGQLTVSAAISPGIDGTIDQCQVQVAPTSIAAMSLDSRSFKGMTCMLNQPLDLSGIPYAAVYVKLTVSFDPAGVPMQDGSQLPGQYELWMDMLSSTEMEAVG